MADWDSIDWDEKVEAIIKSKEQAKQVNQAEVLTGSAAFTHSESDGNYFEINEQKKKLNESALKVKTSNKLGKKNEVFVQPYSGQDLARIRAFTNNSTEFHNLIFETFGQFEKFIFTHQYDLTHDAIVELLKIDVGLLEVPFHAHHKMLLEEISKLGSFWSQLIEFIKDFLNHKHKDVKFLLSVDMNGFFENLEYLVHNMLVNNSFNHSMELILDEIVAVLKSFNGSKWSQPDRLEILQVEYENNLNVHRIYDIYPSIEDLKAEPENLCVNIVKGEYQNVSHYLQVQLPLLREDFVNKLRDGVQQLRVNKPSNDIVKTPSVWIHSNAQIEAVTKSTWNMNCRSIVVNLNHQHKASINWGRRFFNGQMLCFSSTKDFDDLVIAIVIHRDSTKQQPGDINIEIIRTENISDVFNRNFIMIEPVTFFEPYHRVFNVMKNLNELNFPFKDQILKLNKEKKFPSYTHSKNFTYKDFTFTVDKFNEWPSNEQLGLEAMQLKAVQRAVTSEFTIIQGPPGTGKTFIGLEILKIVLENTNETILILTQTNNALDKFLLGASKFTESIARMGGQCKCKELEPFIHKSLTPFESKKYMKKLQYQHRDELERLKGNDDEIFKRVSEHHRLIEEVHQLSSFLTVCQKRVVGMTTTFAARNSSINKMLKPGIVIVEEASEVLESHVLVSLTTATKQLIMIGDHQQLKPLTNSHNLAKNFNFNVSLFERMIRNDFDFITLDVQMRMKPEICDLVRGTIYKSLKDGASVQVQSVQSRIQGMSTNLFCLNHSCTESVGDGETSKANLFEAEYVVQLSKHLITVGNTSDQITILTAYAAQAQIIRKRLEDLQLSEVKVAVLDAYQGEESEIILLSLVRSNNQREIGFLATENRIAVLLSRAKFGFYIIANMDCLAGASPTWKKVRDILKKKKAIGDNIPGVEIIVK